MDYFVILAILLVPACRYIPPLLPNQIFIKQLAFVPKTSPITPWVRLRGIISIAMALGPPQKMDRDLFLVMTYLVVVFSILVQGLTVEKLVETYAT
jgi:CPA1 family monovalent cation:H+ antiporter